MKSAQDGGTSGGSPSHGHGFTEKKIVFAVTAPQSINLLGGLPGEMLRRGWAVQVVSSGSVRGARKVVSGSVQFHTIPMQRTISVFRDLKSLGGWISFLKEQRPHILFFATPKASLLASVAGFFAGVPHRIYGLWGLRSETTKGPRRFVLLSSERLTSFASTAIIAVSPSLRRAYVEGGFAEPNKVTVLGNGGSKGVDLEVFSRAAAKRAPNQNNLAKNIGLVARVPVIGIFGRLNSDKGLFILAEALQRLSPSCGPFQILVVGPNESTVDIHNLLSAANRRVVHIPEAEDLARFYSLVDFLCLPTMREGLPNVVLEAAAMGVPSITTNATGAVDSVEHMVSGIIVHKGSARDLARNIEILVNDEALRRKLGRQAPGWVANRFDSKTVVELHADYLTSLHK